MAENKTQLGGPLLPLKFLVPSRAVEDIVDWRAPILFVSIADPGQSSVEGYGVGVAIVMSRTFHEKALKGEIEPRHMAGAVQIVLEQASAAVRTFGVGLLGAAADKTKNDGEEWKNNAA